MATIKFKLKWTEVDDAVVELGDLLGQSSVKMSERDDGLHIELNARDIDGIATRLEKLKVPWQQQQDPAGRTVSGMAQLASKRFGKAIAQFQEAGAEVAGVTANVRAGSELETDPQKRKRPPTTNDQTRTTRYTVSEDGRIVTGTELPEDCAEQIYISNGLAESTGRIGFSLWTSETDWYGNNALIAETLDRARTEATAAALRAIDEYLSTHAFLCPKPCMPQVKIELFEPSLPGPSMGAATIGEAGLEAGMSGKDPGVTVTTSFGIYYLVLTVRWAAYLVCRHAPDFDTTILPGDHGLRMGSDEKRTGKCPSWSAWGFARRKGLLAARRAPDEPWRAPRDPWEVLDASAIAAARDSIAPAVRDEAYRAAAQAAVNHLERVGEMCPPGCPETTSQIVLLPWLQFERVDPLKAPDGADGYFLVVDCFWTATHSCSG